MKFASALQGAQFRFMAVEKDYSAINTIRKYNNAGVHQSWPHAKTKLSKCMARASICAYKKIPIKDCNWTVISKCIHDHKDQYRTTS